MEQKPINEMNLRECNEEIEAAGGRGLKRIDHARNLVDAIRRGKTTGAAAADKAAKRAVKKSKQTAQADKPGTPALTNGQAEDVQIEPMKGGKGASVATKTAKKAARKASRNSNGKSIIADTFRSQYKKDKAHKTESGAPSVHCGDGLASAMAGLDNDTITKVARENKVDAGKWSSLNPGQIRMNLGNVLRGMIRRGEKVTVQGKAVKL